MTENIVTGKKYRILTDAANDIWDRISFWSKASDVQYDDNTTAEANKAVAILKRNASYTVGAVAYEPSAPSWVLLKCTQAGTTAAVIPSTYSTISSVGTVITDGTARFTVYDVRPSATLSTSAFQVPAMSLVNGLNSELTANGNKFYFDYQNGKYGYNTSASRAAASFVPFGGTNTITQIAITPTAQYISGTSFTTTLDLSAYEFDIIICAYVAVTSPSFGGSSLNYILINSDNTYQVGVYWSGNIDYLRISSFSIDYSTKIATIGWGKSTSGAFYITPSFNFRVM